jgi:hypothetical protein
MSDEAILTNILFPKIAQGKAILLLGAGASVTDEKVYLSKQIIEYYSKKHSLEMGIGDLTEFVDNLAEDPAFSRREFDDFVQKMVEKLKPEETHRIIVKVPWKEILTTNIDLIIERAFDDIRTTPEKNYEIKPIKSVKEESYTQAPDEIRYVKLHGCASSRDKYPFVFSTKDFNEKAKPFYKKVLYKLRNLSPEIELISVGYSYSDPFAKHFLSQFDEMARQRRRRIYNVDPVSSVDRIPFFKANGIELITLNCKEFFSQYQKWLEEQDEAIVTRRGTKFFDINSRKIKVPAYLARKLGEGIKALSLEDNVKFVRPQDFYSGEEPTLGVISQGLDVENKALESRALRIITELIANDDVSTPIFLIEGSFGVGKSTLLLRLMMEAIKNPDFSAVAFQVIEPAKLQTEALKELFLKTKAKTVFLVVENIEADSNYREFRFLHSRLAMEQFSDFKVVLVSSIRENILEKFRQTSPLPDTTIFPMDCNWKKEQIIELLKKLEDVKLITFPDARSRIRKAEEILSDFNGDLLVSLLSILKSSGHQAILRDAISQLSDEAQKTLLFTSLLNQHQIKMPLGLVRSLIGIEWDQVRDRVLTVDFKGFVNREESQERGLDPDTYLQIRHRRIAEIIVQISYLTKDKLFHAYKELVNHLEPTSFNATILVDLLKAIRQKNEISQSKIDALYDLAINEFHLEPHFVIHYSINLERRGTKEALQQAINEIRHITSVLDVLNNDRLIHRRAVATAELAKLVFDDSTVSALEFDEYVIDADIFFERKLLLDPQSHFSYQRYLEFEIWCERTLNEDEETKLQRRVRIAALFDQAESMITENMDKIHELKRAYAISSHQRDKKGYLAALDRLAVSDYQKPYVLVLKYYFHLDNDELHECEGLIRQMEAFQENDAVAAVLFRHYGEALHTPNNRVRFWQFLKAHRELEQTQPIRYQFYAAIISAYDRRFHDARQIFKKLTETYRYFNKRLEEPWRSTTTFRPEIFEGIVESKRTKKFVHVLDLQQSFPIRHSHNSPDLASGERCTVILKFYPYGIVAFVQEVVKSE